MRRVWGLALILAIVTIPPLSCEAQEEWVRPALREQARWNCEWLGSCDRWYRYLRWRDRQVQYRAYRRQVEASSAYRPQVRGYIQRERDDYDERRGVDCRDRRRVVGDQHLTVAGAQGQADKAWQQDVRFYIGERYMDIKNAQSVRYECSRSSVGETLGQVFTRCEVSARPCRGQIMEGEARQ